MRQKAFKRRAHSIANRNRERELELLKFKHEPRKKFNQNVLSVLTTPSNVRMRAAATFRGGGSVSVPSPRAVSVIPSPTVGFSRGQDDLTADSIYEANEQNMAMHNRALIAKSSFVTKSPVGQLRTAEAIARLLNDKDRQWTKDRLVEAVNEHYEWLKTKIHAQSLVN